MSAARTSRTLVAHLTDLHVTAPGERLPGSVDSNGSALAAIDAINHLTPMPDAVIVSGDVTEAGRPDEYREARRLLDRLPVPYVAVPGNHDDRAALVDALHPAAGAVDPGLGAAPIVMTLGPVTLIGLDSLWPGREEGRIGRKQLAWLDQQLKIAAAAGRAALLFVHHPPIDSGIWWMDSARLSDSQAFAAVVERHSHVVVVACGHLHQAMSRTWAKTTVHVGASTAYEVRLDLRAEAQPHVVTAPPGLSLYAIENGEVTTYDLRVSPGVSLFPHQADWGATRDSWRRRKATLR